MVKFLKWLGVLSFVSAFGFVMAGIWFADMKFVWMGVVTFVFSGFSAGYAEMVSE